MKVLEFGLHSARILKPHDLTAWTKRAQ